MPAREITESDVAEQIKLVSFSNSIRSGGERFRYVLCLKATNEGLQTFGWSGLSICIPTIDTKNLYWATEFETNAKGSEGTIHAPGDPVWSFQNDGRWERFPAKYALIETVVKSWEPRGSIELNTALKIPCSSIRIGVRAWANCDRNDWTQMVIGVPPWQSTEPKDQQGIPAYWQSICLGHNTE